MKRLTPGKVAELFERVIRAVAWRDALWRSRMKIHLPAPAGLFSKWRIVMCRRTDNLILQRAIAIVLHKSGCLPIPGQSR